MNTKLYGVIINIQGKQLALPFFYCHFQIGGATMSLLVYKQRHYDINDKKTPMSNVHYMRYIATRPGVMRNEHSGHGLFGNLNPEGVVKNIDEDWSKAWDEIVDISQKKRHVFRSVISFDEEGAARQGLGTRKDWENLINTQVRKIAEGNDIAVQHMRWVAAVHDEAGHPHCHIMLWDNGPPKVKQNFVGQKVPDKIRCEMIKDLYREEFEEYKRLREESKGEFRAYSGDLFADFEEAMNSMNNREFNDLKKGKIRKRYRDDIAPNALLRISKDLFELRKKVPKKGSLKYGYLEPEIKKEVDEVVRQLLAEDSQLRKMRECCIERKMDLVSLYRDPDPEGKWAKGRWDKERKKAEDEIDRLIANKILDGIKELNKTEKHLEYTERMKRYYTKDIILSVFYLLDSLGDHDEHGPKDHFHKDVFNRGLSLQARREFAKKHQHGHGW